MVAENEGVMYYSDYFPVEEGAKYRFQCRWRSNGPAVKVFIKCYAEEDSPYRPAPGPGLAAAARRSEEAATSPSKMRREVYRSQQNLSGPGRHLDLEHAHRGLHAETHAIHAPSGAA